MTYPGLKYASGCLMGERETAYQVNDHHDYGSFSFFLDFIAIQPLMIDIVLLTDGWTDGHNESSRYV
jgi:hypothetical protein